MRRKRKEKLDFKAKLYVDRNTFWFLLCLFLQIISQIFDNKFEEKEEEPLELPGFKSMVSVSESWCAEKLSYRISELNVFFEV